MSEGRPGVDTQWGEVPVATGPLCCREGEGAERRPAHRGANAASQPAGSRPPLLLLLLLHCCLGSLAVASSVLFSLALSGRGRPALGLPSNVFSRKGEILSFSIAPWINISVCVCARVCVSPPWISLGYTSPCRRF